jgi:MFS transporter, DHA3 family, tetracycline resistance protein
MPLRDARAVYLTRAAVAGLLSTTVWTTAAVYFIDQVHLGPLQLVLLGTALEASIFAFEIPTGIVADTAGRRRSIIIGTLLIGAAWILSGAIPLFPVILAAQALWGLGWTFTSGATEAWIAGEVGDRAVGPLFLRAAQYGRVGAAVGIGLSVALASVGLGLPLLVGGALQLALGAWLLLVMPETSFRPAARTERGSWRQLAVTARDGLGAARRDRTLVVLFVIALFAGMSTEGIDRLWQLHLLRDIGIPGLGRLEPVIWFGVIQMAALALGVAVIQPVRRRVDTSDPAALCRLLLVLTVIEAAAMLTVGLAAGFGLAVLAYLAYASIRGLRDPLYGAWIVPMVEPRSRATVLSALGQADAVGEILGGPVFGVVATVTAPGVAIAASGAALAPVAALLAHLRGRVRAAVRPAQGTPTGRDPEDTRQ